MTTDWRISPALAADVAGAAPALVILADRDALYDEGLHYAQRLRQAGVEVTMRVYPGMIHGFINMGAVLRAAGETIDVATAPAPAAGRRTALAHALAGSGHPVAPRAFQVHQQQRNRRRGHAGDALRLTDGLRAHAFEFLLHFGR